MTPAELVARAQRPVPAHAAAVLRIVLGAVGLVIAVRYLAYGWVDLLLSGPMRHFSYPGLGWVRAWPEPWMSIHVGMMGAAAIGVALGWRYRWSLGAFAVLFAWVELIDQTLYINHYYWLAITAGVAWFLPLDRAWSLDARRRGSAPMIPSYVMWLLRSQVGMVYVFAGIAKINADWLLHAEPLGTWLGARSDFPIVGGVLGIGWVAFALSWMGALFDLSVVPFLLWRRTRPWVYGVLLIFHTVTWVLFPSIGVFPLVMALAALVFFPPDWPLRLVRRFGAWRPVSSPQPIPVPARLRPLDVLRVALVGAYIAAMVVVPLRGMVDADTLWSAAAYRFGWRVMLTEKSGAVDFRVTDPLSGDTWVVDEPDGLTTRQSAVMATDPILIRAAAAMVAEDFLRLGVTDVEVRADAFLAFNGRRSQRFIDPEVDLLVPRRDTGWVLAPPQD